MYDTDLELLPIHKYPEYKADCCKLINSEWKRSEIARMRSLDTSCDDLPISLILVNKNTELLGHCKLAKIPNMLNACFMESVVIDKNKRNCGFGKCLMKHVENYARKQLCKTMIYLRTRDQVGFYLKLGYSICDPISLYGNCNFIPTQNVTTLTYMLKVL